MAYLRNSRYLLLWAFQLALLVQTKVYCIQYKVGDLNSWGIPSSANPLVYAKWSKSQTFKIGDSLLFLYPPSEDSVAQVTEQAYKSCNITDPILYMDNGNSLFNITTEGEFYFTSGKPGHCQKKQKLRIAVGNVTASADSPSSLPATAPSYPTVFGSIPLPPSASASSSSSLLSFPVILTAVLGLAVSAITRGTM